MKRSRAFCDLTLLEEESSSHSRKYQTIGASYYYYHTHTNGNLSTSANASSLSHSGGGGNNHSHNNSSSSNNHSTSTVLVPYRHEEFDSTSFRVGDNAGHVALTHLDVDWKNSHPKEFSVKEELCNPIHQSAGALEDLGVQEGKEAESDESAMALSASSSGRQFAPKCSPDEIDLVSSYIRNMRLYHMVETINRTNENGIGFVL